MKRLIFLLIIAFALLQGCTAMKANMALSSKNYSEAVTLYDQCLLESPDDYKLLAKRGFAHLKLGELDQAQADLEKSLAIKPEYPYAVLYLGMTYLNKGDEANAILTWKKYEDDESPLVEDEIKRQLTILEMVHSHTLAKKALEQEEQLDVLSVKPGSVAVVYFDDRTPDKEFRAYQKALAAMISTDLAKIQALNLVERVRIQALLEEMRLGQTGIVDEQTAPRVGKLLGAERVVVGTMTKGSIKVTASVAPVSGAAPEGFSLTAPVDKFYELEKGIVSSIVKATGAPLTNEEREEVEAYHTKSLKAFELFGMGLEAMDAGNWENAVDLFNQALKEDPLFSLARDTRDSSPDSNDVDVSQLKAATLEEVNKIVADTISMQVENSIDNAMDKQEEENREAATSSGSDGGGY